MIIDHSWTFITNHVTITCCHKQKFHNTEAPLYFSVLSMYSRNYVFKVLFVTKVTWRLKMWFRHFQWIWDYRVLGNTDGGQLLSQMPSVLDFGSTGYSHPDNMFTNLSEFSQIFTNEWNWIFLNEHIYIKKTVLMAQFFYEQKCSNNRFRTTYNEITRLSILLNRISKNKIPKIPKFCCYPHFRLDRGRLRSNQTKTQTRLNQN